MSNDPCEGGGNFREPAQFDYEDEEESTETELKEEIANLSKKLDNLTRRGR
jgi:hypothetical protein